MTLLAVSIVAGLAATGTSSPQPAEEIWTDPSPHVEGFVQASAGALHYLQWGGQGDVVLLLAGLGNTAHVFDELAPLLADSFRVLALTRRGYGESACPPDGYDTDTLARDLLEFLDAVGVERAHLVGHSIAGHEITRFASLHPGRVGGIVYLDAAYDRSALRKVLLMARVTSPKPRWPESEVRATRRSQDDDHYAEDVTPAGTNARVMLETRPPDFRAVRAPVLGIFALQDSASAAHPWRAFAEEQRRKLAAEADDATVLEVHAPHYLFLSHPHEVACLVRDFLARDVVAGAGAVR
jgi:non-heme chloroperoxidase